MLDRDELTRWERLTAAMLVQAATDDPAAFAQVVGLLDRARELLPDVAYQLRVRASASGGDKLDGYSWADLAESLGVTRSAAAQRFDASRRVLPAGESDAPLSVQFRSYIAGR